MLFLPMSSSSLKKKSIEVPIAHIADAMNSKYRHAIKASGHVRHFVLFENCDA